MWSRLFIAYCEKVVLIVPSVVAVHALGAIPSDTWKEKTSGVSWLQDEHMLPSKLPTARIMTFGYDSIWFGKDPVKTSLPSIARSLLAALQYNRKVKFMPYG